MNYLNIDALRATGAKPHWFGLGFIQLKLTETERMHFWLPEDSGITAAEEEPHDHRYRFVSTVLIGSIVNRRFRFDPAGDPDDEMVEVTCEPGQEGEPRLLGVGWREVVSTELIDVDDLHQSYAMEAGEFHQAWPLAPTVTLLRRGGYEKATARVIRRRGEPLVCPFSAPKAEAECWEIMANMLLRARK